MMGHHGARGEVGSSGIVGWRGAPDDKAAEAKPAPHCPGAERPGNVGSQPRVERVACNELAALALFDLISFNIR